MKKLWKCGACKPQRESKGEGGGQVGESDLVVSPLRVSGRLAFERLLLRK
jgi:hypothetical protein